MLVPEVVDAVKPYGDIPVLAARRHRHRAANGSLHGHGRGGAPGPASVWLTHRPRPRPPPSVKEKMLAASSRQTVRSRSRTGKYTRQLRSAWTDAWQDENAPDPLPDAPARPGQRAGAAQDR